MDHIKKVDSSQVAFTPDPSLPEDDEHTPTATAIEVADSSDHAEKENEKPGTEPDLVDQTNFLPTRQVVMVFLGLSIALACSFLDQTIVATALPRISSDLHGGRSSSWVATAYLLTSLACTPLYGRWSDVFGRKQVLLVSLAIFLLFSLACALARTMLQLIIFRALQGIGGGAIITMVLIIVSDIVSLKERGKYQGIAEGVIALSNGFGPVIGGLFSEYTTWRWAFWINLPLGGIAIVVGIWLLPLKGVGGDLRRKFLQIDYVGSLLTILASVLLLLGLNWGGTTYPWVSAPVLVTLLLGVGFFVVFIIWEARFAKLPIIPVHIFRNKTVVGVLIITMMVGMTFFSILYYMPQFLQLVRGNSPVKSSLLLVPFLGLIPFVVFSTGQFVSHVGHYRYLIIFGFALWSVSQGLQTTIDEHSSTGRIIGYLVLAGFASGFVFQTSLLAAQAAVPRREMAVVTGVRNFLRLMGSTLGLAISASIVNNNLRTVISSIGLTTDQINALLDDPTIINDPAKIALTAEEKAIVIAAYTKGFRNVFYLTLACTLVAFLAAVFLVEQHDLNRADDNELKRQGKEFIKQRKMKGAAQDIEAGREEPPSEKDSQVGDEDGKHVLEADHCDTKRPEDAGYTPSTLERKS